MIDRMEVSWVDTCSEREDWADMVCPRENCFLCLGYGRFTCHSRVDTHIETNATSAFVE